MRFIGEWIRSWLGSGEHLQIPKALQKNWVHILRCAGFTVTIWDKNQWLFDPKRRSLADKLGLDLSDPTRIGLSADVFHSDLDDAIVICARENGQKEGIILSSHFRVRSPTADMRKTHERVFSTLKAHGAVTYP